MKTYYEHIKTRIKGMVSSAFLDLVDHELDFNLFIEYLELIHYQISESDFEYHILYDESATLSEKYYSNFITLDNSIYIEIKTYSKDEVEKNIIDMENTKINNICAYSSQINNKKLIKFMNVVNTFIIKNKEEKEC